MKFNRAILAILGCTVIQLSTASLAYAEEYVVFQNGSYIKVDSCVMVETEDGFYADWGSGSSSSGVCDNEHPVVKQEDTDIRISRDRFVDRKAIVGAVVCPVGTKLQANKTCQLVDSRKFFGKKVVGRPLRQQPIQ